MYKYFCGSCGHKFSSELPERDDHGFLNDIPCPACGAWDVYPDTEKGHAEELNAFLEYDNCFVTD